MSNNASSVSIASPLQGTVWKVAVSEGDTVTAGQTIMILESMKMEHVIEAPGSGTISTLVVAETDQVSKGDALAVLSPGAVEVESTETADATDEPNARRADLAEVLERHAVGMDERRPDAVEKRRKRGQRTARENVYDLVNRDTFVEYAPLAIAMQRRRRELDDLIARTPADGLVSGVGSVNADLFGEDNSQCVVLSYDFTVLAGTQGHQNHRKKDRLFEIARQQELPVIFFTEGGGGRPGDTDAPGVAGLDCWAFAYWGALSGSVPMIGINSGYCFAGNAAILACCDVIIATRNSNIGMAGPAMIEGGGLGVYEPSEIGPSERQVANGVIDILVEDEAEAVAVARQYLSYFQGPVEDWSAPNQDLLRDVIPENRKQVYDMHTVVDGLVDTDSFLELRPDWATGMITGLARIQGRPVGVIGNNTTHLAGAIDANGATKAARFMQLCDGHDIPILFLCDTPGFMVGPESEDEGMVRHAGRLFVAGGSLTVPFFTIVTRKGYGLGAQAMAGGSFKAPLFCVAWPTGEFGGMGLEGYVQLGYRKELEAVSDPAEREKLYQELVDKMYAHGRAVNMASHFEIDDVIDPADSRKWILSALRGAPARDPHATTRSMIDTW